LALPQLAARKFETAMSGLSTLRPHGIMPLALMRHAAQPLLSWPTPPQRSLGLPLQAQAQELLKFFNVSRHHGCVRVLTSRW
jgi:hypothetical protein